MEFLWVRWFDVVASVPAQTGWSSALLDELRFVSFTEKGAFGFVDPTNVLRACHIIPRFALGKVVNYGSRKSGCAGDESDWKVYFANR